MQEFIVLENLRRLRARLPSAANATQQAVIEALIVDYEAKLAGLSQSQPPGANDHALLQAPSTPIRASAANMRARLT